jgi:hypothetical protein
MSTDITKTEIMNCLEELLKNEGYQLRSKIGLFTLGPDIKASKDSENWYIEVLASGESRRGMVEDFYNVFFRAVSRLNNEDCQHCIIAVPENLRKYLYIRARIYRVAWERIADVFPELEIWVVDSESNKYQKTSWNYWLIRKRLFKTQF